jgi:hypothetical protein
MQNPGQDKPVDILAEPPAELSEEPPAQIEVDPLADKLESEEAQAISSKKYSNEDVYTMVSLVLRYPSGGHGGETFWTWMVKIYGNSLLEGRNGSGLRNRWRKISKEHPSDLREYKKQLAEGLPKKVVENVDKNIEEEIADVGSLGLSSKAYSSLFPEMPRPPDPKEAERASRKRNKPEDNNIDASPHEEKKKMKKTSTKGGIDLDTLISKTTKDLSKLIEDTDVAGMEARITLGKDLVIIRDLKTNSIVIKSQAAGPLPNEFHLKKPKVKQCGILRDCGSKANTDNKQWTEIEDLVLKHPEYIDLNNCLLKTKGAEEVAKRKRILGII